MKKHIYLNPFLVAYALFILVALIIKAVFNSCDWSNNSWERIVAAVTVSSYFFTTSAMFQSMADSFEKLLSLASDIDSYFSHMDNINDAINRLYHEKCSVYKNSEVEYQYTEIKKELEKKTKLITITYYSFVVIAFLSFLVIVSYEILYTYIYAKLSVFSMFAFFVMLITELWREKTNNDLVEKKKKTEKLYDRYLRVTEERIASFIDIIELEEQNGQDEDGE